MKDERGRPSLATCHSSLVTRHLSLKKKPAVLGGKPVFGKPVPFSHPGLPPSPALLKNLSRVLATGPLSKGPLVSRFEAQCAAFLGVDHSIAVSSCVSGLVLSLQALESSGEVIVPSFTFPAAATAIVQSGLRPVFADCDPETFNVDPDHVGRLVSRKTVAIMPVYNYGLPPDIERLEKISTEHGIPLIFDSAQAWGAVHNGKRAGGFGLAEVFSFSQSKVLTTCEGGLVATNDRALAERIRQGRNYGKGDNGEFLFAGLSCRLSEIHALIGMERLKSASDFLKKRKALAGLYREHLKNIEGIKFQRVEEAAQGSENYFPIFIDAKKFGLHRDVLFRALARENIESSKLFSPPCHGHKAFKKYRKGQLPRSDEASGECLALPLYTGLEKKKALGICEAIERIYRFRGDINRIILASISRQNPFSPVPRQGRVHPAK